MLEDPITKALSLLFFASFPGTSRRARFVDIPGEGHPYFPWLEPCLRIQADASLVNDLGTPSQKSKLVKLLFQAASRRGSMDSVASGFSQDSRQSTLTSLGSSSRGKYLELEFYEERGMYMRPQEPLANYALSV